MKGADLVVEQVNPLCGDEVTLDLLIQRKAVHDKTAWMLSSSFEGESAQTKKRMHDDSLV